LIWQVPKAQKRGHSVSEQVGFVVVEALAVGANAHVAGEFVCVDGVGLGKAYENS
jgi:hypothetical protein